MKKLILLMLLSSSAFAMSQPIAVCRGIDPTGKAVIYRLNKTKVAPTFLSLTIKNAGAKPVTFAITSADPASTADHVIVYAGPVYLTVDRGAGSSGTAGAMGIPQTKLICNGNW
jgi:hypothetical protein